MKSLAKAQALVRDLSDKLKVRFAGSSTIDTVALSQDSAGWPMIICSDGGTLTAGSAVIAIRIKASQSYQDVFGNSVDAFAPHKLEIACELSAANNPLPIDADLEKAKFEAYKLGAAVSVIELANGTAVTAANMDAATPIVELEDLQWPTKGV